MNKSRVKLQKPAVPTPSTREEAEAVVREIAQAKIRERALKADMDTEIAAIKENYESELSTLADSIQPLMEAVHAWADTHPDIFGARKSLEMLHGVVGWRITPPSLKPAKGYTWQAVVDRLKTLSRFEFIRVKEEPNKEAILAARESEDLKPFFCQVIQEDEFYVDPKLTTTTNRETK